MAVFRGNCNELRAKEKKQSLWGSFFLSSSECSEKFKRHPIDPKSNKKIIKMFALEAANLDNYFQL